MNPTKRFTPDAMAQAFRNPRALTKLDAVISKLDRTGVHTDTVEPLSPEQPDPEVAGYDEA